MRRAYGWRSRVKPAHVENRFSVSFTIGRQAHDFLVACTFAFLDQTPLDPPHQGMEPEHALYNHVKKRGEIVSAPNMAVFMLNDRVQLIR
jgi:hypothetical protein